MKEVKIISATQSTCTESNKFLLAKYLNKFMCKEKITWDITYKNTEGLAKIYNKAIKDPENYNKILLFVHDDCVIEDAFLVEKLNEALEQFDIIGLAGMKAPINLKPPCLWHLMGDRTNGSGSVGHFDKEGVTRWMTTFGPAPQRVILLDGVFIAINTKKIFDKQLFFDEQNPAKFHFYDLNLSLDANKRGLKLSTWPIWVTHRSHGLEKPTEDWLKGQDYFLQKYTAQ